MSIFENIRNVSDLIAQQYNLDIFIFFIIYFSSFLPFYLGYFLILYGTTRSITFNDFISFNIRKNIRWTDTAKIGLIIHIIGRLMPYLYILFFGDNLPTLIIVLLYVVIIVSILYMVKKVFAPRSGLDDSVYVTSYNDVKNLTKTDEILWNIYDSTFSKLNEKSPCKQSLDQVHFVEALHNPQVKKYILIKKPEEIIGIALITNDFNMTPWISEDFFKVKYPDEYSKKLIYYFMGLAISKGHRGNKYSLGLIEKIIDDLPDGASMGFDHSININPMLHNFTKVVKQAHLIERTYLDRQHYHIVSRKK